MTSAEFKTMREALGLSAAQVAEMTGYALRTVQNWDDGSRRVPAAAEATLSQLDAMIENVVAGAVQTVKQVSNERGGEPEAVWLVRYRTDADLHRYRPDMAAFPASLHAAMLARVRRELFKLGVVSRIVFMRPDDYEDWRRRAGLDDSEEARAGWASMQE